MPSNQPSCPTLKLTWTATPDGTIRIADTWKLINISVDQFMPHVQYAGRWWFMVGNVLNSETFPTALTAQLAAEEAAREGLTKLVEKLNRQTEASNAQ